ncbi:hypothetical protein ACH5RR_014420 [Cinchona calisaya]|uniref:CASP-like protein n=1 Tax=Cinchona calisaya TaxID=153742 RepID=A0ABD3A3E8_9GENT
MENSRKSSISSDKEDLGAVGSSTHNSQEFKQPTRRSSEYSPDESCQEFKQPTTRSLEYSPDGSSISSDHTSLTHGSSPAPTPGEEQTTQNPPGKLHPMPQLPAPAPVSAINRYAVDETFSVSKKADPGWREGRVEEGERVGGSGRRFRPSISILRRVKRELMVKKTALGFRVFGFLFSLVSFSVMAADKNKGWPLDSFDRYKEFRYCMTVNVIAFAYSGAQALDLSYQLSTGKSILLHHFRYYFDFAIDQMISYLLISASSSSATRIEDWESNWGKDKFPDMASTAVSMSFLAFAALAFSSVISGYGLCRSGSM